MINYAVQLYWKIVFLQKSHEYFCNVIENFPSTNKLSWLMRWIDFNNSEINFLGQVFE